MSYQTIETEIIDGTFVLCHARGDKLNARNAQMYVEITAVLEAVRGDALQCGFTLS
jgi:enoyl-CoA hydratase/carnithine racemase